MIQEEATDNRHSHQARRYLEAMGIDVWLPRDAALSTPQKAIDPDPLPVSSNDNVPTNALDWEALRSRVAGCTACGLHQGRTQTVFGVGNQTADWMIIGEAPGEQEDRQGEPFVGRGGQLLDNMLRAVGLVRDKVYIANILKCRPPGNRDPQSEETAQCTAYLQRQIALVQPKVIVAVGRVAAQYLLNNDTPIGRLRGRVHDYNGIPLVVTYHPAYLLRSPQEKRKAWQDMQLVSKTHAET